MIYSIVKLPWDLQIFYYIFSRIQSTGTCDLHPKKFKWKEGSSGTSFQMQMMSVFTGSQSFETGLVVFDKLQF